MMNRASWVSSDEELSEDNDSGGRPDLLSSPEVLTWRRMLSGGRSAERYLFKLDAPFVEVTVCTA